MTFFQITSKIFPISKKVFVAPIGDVLVIEFSTKTEASKKKVVAINLEKNHVRKFYWLTRRGEVLRKELFWFR